MINANFVLKAVFTPSLDTTLVSLKSRKEVSRTSINIPTKLMGNTFVRINPYVIFFFFLDIFLFFFHFSDKVCVVFYERLPLDSKHCFSKSKQTHKFLPTYFFCFTKLISYCLFFCPSLCCIKPPLRCDV